MSVYYTSVIENPLAERNVLSTGFPVFGANNIILFVIAIVVDMC